jgi:hypothetical protein
MVITTTQQQKPTTKAKTSIVMLGLSLRHKVAYLLHTIETNTPQRA